MNDFYIRYSDEDQPEVIAATIVRWADRHQLRR
jgi:hypothetical protein